MPQWIGQGLWSYWRSAAGSVARPTALLERVGLGHRLSTGRPSSPAARCSARRSRGRWPASRRAPGRRADRQPRRRQRPGVLELLRDLNRERGLTMIVVTHDPHIAQQADRVVRLAEGRIEEWSTALA